MIESLGKYRILERIGRGGMGAVYKADDPVLKRVVALKVISEDVDVLDELRVRFFREAQACAQLSHPNIITIYDLGEEAGRLFIVMEYLEGEELKQVITERRELPLESKLAMMVQICEGLAYAHQKGIVHRDVKPGNVFILRNGTVKVLDFGVARVLSANADLTRTGRIMGTFRYMSPEQARGQVDHRSDIFSAGVVFYELLTYRPPQSGDDPMAILEELYSTASPSLFRPDPAIPEALEAVIERALRKKPEERFSDMREMRDALVAVRARLDEEATVLRQRLQARATEMRQLHARLEEQTGGRVTQDELSIPADRAPVAVLQASWQKSEEAVGSLRLQAARATALRGAYDDAVDRMRREQWQAAVEGFERILAEMPEHAGARAGLSQARAEVIRAAEAAQRERAAAEDARRLMEDLRHRAGAAALLDADGSWGLAEANREAGLSALAEESLVTARERFGAAVEQYRTAGDAVEHRLQHLLREARRLLEERDFEECLTLVEEVLRLAPEQSEALDLGRAARVGAREEADRRAALEQRYDTARAQLAAGDLRGAIDALAGLVEQEPGHSRAQQLLEETRAQLAEEQEHTRLFPALPNPELIDATVYEMKPAADVEPPQLERAAPEPLRSPEAMPETIEPPAPSAAEQSGVGETELPPMGSSVEGPQAVPAGLAGRGWIRGHRLVLAGAASIVIALSILWVVTSLAPSRRLQGEFEQAQKHLEASRGEALKVEADRLAADLFAGAGAKVRDGEQLTRTGRLRAAIDMLRQAAMRYEEAAGAARAIGEERTKADQARVAMLTEKERAASGTAEFKEALARESAGDGQYRKLAFQDAAESFRAAARLFGTAPAPTSATPAPAPTAPDAAAEIREMLRLYAQVFQAKDLALLQQLRPGISPEELSRYRAVFERTRSYRLNLKVDAIKVNGDEAEAKGRREDVVVTSNGDTVRTPGDFRFRLKRSNNRWAIEAVR